MDTLNCKAKEKKQDNVMDYGRLAWSHDHIRVGPAYSRRIVDGGQTEAILKNSAVHHSHHINQHMQAFRIAPPKFYATQWASSRRSTFQRQVATRNFTWSLFLYKKAVDKLVIFREITHTPIEYRDDSCQTHMKKVIQMIFRSDQRFNR